LEENTVVLSRALTQHGRKSARQNRYAFDSRQLNLIVLHLSILINRNLMAFKVQKAIISVLYDYEFNSRR
ncbi:MAG: hypothetical protein KHW95_02630, partial [Firmicutes bacterium]|nr:hypothetical protein [Bacillota bacterium]